MAKRISLHIPSELNAQLHAFAGVVGTKHSKLANKIIAEFDPLDPHGILLDSKQRNELPTSVQYTVRIRLEHWDRLVHFAHERDCALSVLLRAVLENGLRQQFKILARETFAQVEKRQEELMPNIRSLLRAVTGGDLAAADELFGKVESDAAGMPLDAWPFAYISLARGIHARHTRKLGYAAKMFDEAVEIATRQGIDEVRMSAFSQLGVLADLRGELWQAISYNLKAYSIVERQVNKTEEVKILLRLANLASSQKNARRANYYLDQARLTAPDEVARLQNRQAVSSIRLGEYAAAEASLQKMLDLLGSSSTAETERRYALENLALCSLARGDTPRARGLFQQAAHLEAKLRQPDMLSKSNLYKLFLAAEYDFDGALQKLQQAVEYQREPVYELLGHYLLYATAFIYGDLARQRQGERQLSVLAAGGDNTAIVDAARHTLHSRQLVPLT